MEGVVVAMACCVLAASLAACAFAAADFPTVKVVPEGESKAKAVDCRQMLIGPGVNQPEPFPGYDGFVGWESPIRLKNGTWLVGFSAGHWHASPPTPLRLDEATLKEWVRLGMRTDISAPTGGRALLIRSTDEGRTWSRPELIIDTPADDRHPSFCELPDGTLLCTFFTYPGQGDYSKYPELACRTNILRSMDGGRTWSKPILLPSPFIADATDGPPIVLKDGSVLLAVYGTEKMGVRDHTGIFRSTDSGKTWKLLSVVKCDHEMTEPTIAQLKDGRIVLVTRPESDICWSDDGGKTWTKPVSLGMRIFEPGLITLRDGTLLLIHGSYNAGGGLHATFSTDGGATWIAPALDRGFVIDKSVYGYGKGIELPDGSIFIVYISTGGHSTHDAQTEAIWGIRLRVRDDRSGIDLLPISPPSS